MKIPKITTLLIAITLVAIMLAGCNSSPSKDTLTMSITDFTWTDESGVTSDFPTDVSLWFENAECTSASLTKDYAIKTNAATGYNEIDYDNFDLMLQIKLNVDGKEYTFDLEDGSNLIVNKSEDGGYILLPEESLAMNE
jgi:hypothetical protein